MIMERALAGTRTIASGRKSPMGMTHSLNFDGVDDQITIPNSATTRFGSSDFSISFWFRSRSLSSLIALNKWNTAGWLINVSNTIRFRFFDGTGGRDMINAGRIKIGAWTHIACTISYAQNKASIYQNGVRVSENDLNGLANVDTVGSKDTLIGSLSSSQWLNGRMTGIRLWKGVALSASDVANLYSAGIVPYRSNLVVELGSSIETDGSGSSAVDTSGNGNNGTISGATWSTDVPSRLRVSPQPFIGSLFFDRSNDVVDCGADFLGTGDDTVDVFVRYATAGENNEGRIFTNGSFFAFFNSSRQLSISSDGTTVATTTKTITPSFFNRITIRRYATGLADVFVNGILFEAGLNTGTPAVATSNVLIGDRSASDRCLNGFISSVRVYGRALTNAEILTLHTSGATVYDGTPATMLLNLEVKSGVISGSSWRDQSGNARHGAITGAELVEASPYFQRKHPTNLVNNGDFSIRPYYVAAQSTSGRWMNGTAAGSTRKNKINLYFSYGGTAGVTARMIDKDGRQCVHINIPNAGGFAQARIGSASYYSIPRLNDFRLIPGKTYRYSFEMMTENMTGDSANGAYVSILMSKGDGTSAGGISTQTKKINTPWTTYTGTFVAEATAISAHVELRIYGHTGAATLAGDAYFANVSVVQVD